MLVLKSKPFKPMKLAFESNLQYQQEAIKSITDLFEGQPLEDSSIKSEISEMDTYAHIYSYGNRLVISEEQLLSNLQSIQDRNEIPVADRLNGMHFSVEMETGTGKTYVYLRTIYELNQLYGFKKFVIVVPSVAIREGVQVREPEVQDARPKDRMLEFRAVIVGPIAQALKLMRDRTRGWRDVEDGAGGVVMHHHIVIGAQLANIGGVLKRAFRQRCLDADDLRRALEICAVRDLPADAV